MKNNLIKKLFLLPIIFSLSNCIPNLNSGIITNMVHKPERRYVNTDTITFKIEDISFNIPISKNMIDDEDWIITFQGKVDEKSRERTIYATERFYNNFNVGDKINLSGYVEKPIPFEDYDFDVEAKK